MDTDQPAPTARDICLQWWALHPANSAAKVAAHFNTGPGRAALPAGTDAILPATLRQWKARHGLPPVGGAPVPAGPAELPPGPAAPPKGPAAPGTAAAATWEALDSLVPWADNPRDNDGAIMGVVRSLMRFGVGRPLVAWQQHGARMLVVGHTTRKALLWVADNPRVWDFQAVGGTATTPAVCSHCGAAVDTQHEVGCPGRMPPGVPGPGLVPVRWRDDWTEAEARGYAIADNRTAQEASWLDGELARQLRQLDAEGIQPGSMGWDPDADLHKLLADLEGSGDSGPAKGGDPPPVPLIDQFGAPPFTVLDARQGYWQDRKRAWWALGLDPAAGRDDLGSTANASEGKVDYMTGRGGHATGGSAFDPVLAELSLRWFAPAGGHVLDPFAGEAVKGVVAGVLGYQYTGVEVREAQVAVNRAQWDAVAATQAAAGQALGAPTWLQGDSAQLDQVLPAGAEYDMLLTSPPYYDLEVYSSQSDDGSTLQTYDGFMAWYTVIFRQAVGRLRDGAFVVVKVGDVRDSLGAYRGFVADNIAMFRALGLHYYNEAVLVTPLGTLPVRAGPAMRASRKLGRGHQNVVVLWKGDPREVRSRLGDLPDRYLAGPDPASEGDPGTTGA